MAHAINNETDFVCVVNGVDRHHAWHQLGQTVDKAMTAEQALELANLDWDVELVPVFAFVGEQGDDDKPVTDDDLAIVTGKWATVAVYKDKREVLGIVGERFTPTPNRVLFNFMDGIVGNIGGAHYDTAGYIRPLSRTGQQLAQVFITINLGDAGEVVLDPNGAADKMRHNLYCTAGHDGSLALTAGVTTTRIVCANTQSQALGNSTTKWKMKHTKSIDGRMDAAREALGLTLAGIEQLHEVAEKLVFQNYTDKEFGKLIDTVFPEPKDDAAAAAQTRYDDMRAKMIWLYKDSPTNENIRGTKWAAYQSIGEYLDWFKPVKGDVTSKATRRATVQVTGGNDAKKQRALAVLMA